MAIPSRFIKPARPRKKVSLGINPTFIGVLFSIGAHALLIMFAPRANFSFAALSEAAQQQDAEETIVPVVELTPAERNRLPSFAQPTRTPPTPTGLNSLALPAGLPQLSRPTPTPRTSQSTLPRTTTRRLPSASTRTAIRPQIRQRLPQSVTRAPLTVNPGRVTNRDTPRSSSAVEFFTPNQPSQASPTIGADGLPILEGQTPLNPSSSGSASDLNTQPAGETQPSGDLIGDLLARQNAPDSTSDNRENSAVEAEPDNEESITNVEESGTEIAVEIEAINPAPAQGDPRQLLAGYSYDPTDVDDEAAAENLQNWLAASAENKSEELESATTTLEIDSQFKVCKDNEPSTGLIGVVVNPDGSQEDAEVIKSIGYDILNRQALSAVEYYEFEPPAQSTQYQVAIDVIYEPQGCVEALPEAE